MTKLYEITENLAEIEQLDLDSETLHDTLEALSGEFEQKAEAILAFTENMSSDLTAIDNEIKRLQARKSALKNRKDRLREYLLYNMEKTGITKIECPLFTASIRKGVESIVIDDLDKIPDEYVKTEVKQTPDKKELKAAIKSGADIPGARIERGANTIVLK